MPLGAAVEAALSNLGQAVVNLRLALEAEQAEAAAAELAHLPDAVAALPPVLAMPEAGGRLGGKSAWDLEREEGELNAASWQKSLSMSVHH